MNDKVDFVNLTVQRLHGKPPEWQWCSQDAHDMPEDFIRVGGEVPIGVFVRGKLKGHPKWPDKIEHVYVRNRDIEETERLWELETGKCSKCYGLGEVVRGLPRVASPCRSCGGTGRAMQPEAVANSPAASGAQ
jgi:hypothetical protein